MKYNEQLCRIIYDFHSNAEAHANHWTANSIDLNDCAHKRTQSTETMTSSAADHDEISKQNVRLYWHFMESTILFITSHLQAKLSDENALLQRQIETLQREKNGLEEVLKWNRFNYESIDNDDCIRHFQAAIEARVLVFEVAERHDMIVKLKNEINDMEQQLKQKDTHIQFKDEIIKELRQQRRSYFKVCLPFDDLQYLRRIVRHK